MNDMTQQDDITQPVLTDDEIIKHMEDAGVTFMWIEGRNPLRTTAGSQRVDTLLAGIRAVLSKLRAPVADEKCKRCGGHGWRTDHTTGYPHSIPCSACNPQGVSVERLAKDPFLAAQLWHKPVADGAALASAPVAGEAREHIEQMAVNRYRLVPDGAFSYKVVAGDGTRSLYTGTKDSCLRVAAKLTEAFLDGAFAVAHAAPQASAEDDREALAHKVNLLTAESLGHRSAAGHLSTLVDELCGHLIEARQAMADIEQAFVPAFDTPETLTMVPNEALVPFCTVLDRLRGLDLPQADKDGGQQRAGDADLYDLAIKCGAVLSTEDLSWAFSYRAMREFCVRAHVALSATQPEQGERDEG